MAMAEAGISEHRRKLQHWLELPVVRNTILGIIIFNAVTLGMGTSERISAHIGGFLNVIDDVVLAIFVVEILLKFYAYRLAFFKSAWNIFDLAIPFLVILAVQAVVLGIFSYFVTFKVMGSNYDAAVMAGGHCGFGLGATPTAVMNMGSLVNRFVEAGFLIR